MAHITEVIQSPVLTEKSTKLMQEQNKYTFYVDPKANKTEIKQAAQKMFGVKVTSVNTMNVHPKKKRFGRYEGKTNKKKKAIISLAEGEKINIFGEDADAE